jgi:Arc/MetJ-type ribon-helix-helix transcriptional regulator
MKAVTINVSLNPDLAEFAKADSEAEAFDSVNDYVREMIRRRRRQKIAADVRLLETAMTGAPGGDPSDEEMAEIVKTQKAVRKALRHARRI